MAEKERRNCRIVFLIEATKQRPTEPVCWTGLEASHLACYNHQSILKSPTSSLYGMTGYSPLWKVRFWTFLLSAFAAAAFAPSLHFLSTTRYAKQPAETLTVPVRPSFAEKYEGGSQLLDQSFSIRDALFSDLGQAADVIMSSFYANSTSPWKQMFKLAELGRIQQGFPHMDKDLHRNIVAVADINGKEQVIGFCDLDCRTPNKPTGYRYNPRPYVSDLCIVPQWRRKGVAKAMIKESENYCMKVMGKKEIFIRVESTNHAALGLYKSLDYTLIENPDCPKKLIYLMRKKLPVESAVKVR
jgi:ribosomal protein S18 acetylase RimI-like enzyme